MKYKYFLFDWDGSLANTLPIWFAGYKKVFGMHGIMVTNEIISKEVLGDWDGPRRLGITNEEMFFDELEKEVIDQLNEVKLNPNAYETLTLIKQSGGRIAVVTASKKRWVKTALRASGLRDLVDVFLGREDVEHVKPNPESIQKALKLMSGRAGEAVMIGDNGKDVMAGQRAGVDTGLYFPERYEEYYSEEVQRGWKSTFIFTDFSELKSLM